MADTRTNAEANAEDNDGLELLTPQTKNPLATIDESIIRSVLPLAYRDTRGAWWQVRWTGKAWAAMPLKSTVAKYHDEYGTNWDTKRVVASGSDAPGIISAIEEMLEFERVAAKNRGGSIPWWVWALGLYAWSKRKRR